MPIVNGRGEGNMAGHTIDDAGNTQVDFVWGNLPIQPNTGRDDDLDPALDNHAIVTTGYANYPQFIPNYEGDDDQQLEVVVPDFVRLTIQNAGDLASDIGLDLYTFSHVLTASYVESTAKTVRVTAYDTDFGTWSNASGAALNGLRVGDELDLTALTDDADPVVSLGLGVVKVTNVENDGSDSWFEFKTATALELDTVAVGDIYAGPNLVDVVTVQRPNETAPGDIVDDGRNVNVRYFGEL